MNKGIKPGILFLLLILLFHLNRETAAQMLGWRELIVRTQTEAPKPDHRFYYGEEEMQFCDLWLPEGEGPHPVVIMIHGGCWLSSIPGVVLMELISNDLKDRGIAVWNLEYRRVGHEGGGYPGTFLDVASGADYIRDIAEEYNLDLTKTLTIGHSAGGHLALWLSGRNEISPNSVLFEKDPLKIYAVISLAGIGDLAQFQEFGNLVCGDRIINNLVNLKEEKREDPFHDTSPVELIPENTPQILIHGAYDPIVPPFLGYSYKIKAKTKNGNVTLKLITDAGHFELIAPWTDAWQEVLDELLFLLARD